MIIPLLRFLLLSSLLTGCYTQLATRGHGRIEAPPSYGPAGAAPGDSLAGDSALAAAPPADTLAPPAGTPTVIVNNYYDPFPSYRGYARWEWEYPLISFGYYSSHYGRYSQPWWWEDPWYVRRHYHPRQPDPRHPVHVPARPRKPSGPYQSDKRLYNPEPTHKPVRKGRRADVPVGATQEAPASSAPPPAAPPSGGASETAPAEPEKPVGGGSTKSEAKSSREESGSDREYRSLKKGRRR